MTISFQLPDSFEKQLRRDLGDLEQAAKEALAIEAFRTGKLSLGQFADLLGLSTYEADGLLKEHGVFLDLSEEELSEERDALRKLIGR